MTPLTIIPNYQKKRLKCYGTVAAGEHVLVTVTGGTDWVSLDGENQTLRLRLLFGPHTVGVFPFVTEEMHEADPETFPTVDEWDVDGDDPTCDLNLNTIQAAKFLKFGGNCLFVLDDPTNDILYAIGEFEVLPWPKRRGADLPYDLDGYPDFVFDAKSAMAEAAETAQSAETSAAASAAVAERLENDVAGHRVAAETAATNAQNSASAASNSKQDAEAWAVGERGGAAVGTDDETYHNNAKYYAGQAGDAKTDAETAQGAAESAQAAAEAWATGGTGGTPSATNNAKYYAEQAADSAQDAEETLEDKADKVASATNGNFAGLDANGNLTDSGKKAADFAPATDIAKTALASDVQTSLGKADSAVQPSDILSDGKIKSALLPSFVDDVLEFSALANFPAAGETGKIYVVKDTNKTYRWSGSSYVEISASLALGETSSTAYRGDRGKTAYDHATDSNRLTTAKASGLYKIATTAEGHVKSVTAVEKSDITALGIPAQDTTYTLPPATAATLGGVKQGTGCTIEQDGTLNVTGGGSGETPVAPSTDPAAQGKPADAKATGDALAGKLAKTTAGYAIEENLDGLTITLLDGSGGEKRYDLTKQGNDSVYTLVRLAELDGKADAADLRYRIAEAAVRKTLPADCFPVTFTYDGVSYSINSLVKEGEASAAGDAFIMVNENDYSLMVVESPATGSELMGAIEVATFDAGGVFETSGIQDLQFGGVSPVASTSPTMADIQVLADRTVNLITASDETSIDIELPALANVGRMRDFYVRLTVSATSVAAWTIGQGESWDAMGSPPSSFAAGTYLYHISEVAAGVWHCEDMFGVLNRIPMYQMVGVTPSSGTLTVAPYTVATYTAGDSAAAFTVAVGTGTSGKARDCELVIDCTATGAVAPTVTWPATFHPRTDAATDFACEAGKRNVYFISEFASGEFAVGGWQETAGGNA